MSPNQEEYFLIDIIFESIKPKTLKENFMHPIYQFIFYKLALKRKIRK